MLKIFHRINSNYRLSKIDKKYGVEIDVRSFKNDLIVDHEPFSKNISLSKYLKNSRPSRHLLKRDNSERGFNSSDSGK